MENLDYWHHGAASCHSPAQSQRSGFRHITMASSHYTWIALFLLSAMTSDIGVFGRAVDTLGFLSHSQRSADDASPLRTDTVKRWRRGTAETRRERCAELAAPWLESAQHAPEDNATWLQLRVRPFSPTASRGLVFPGKSLFGFVRRVYHCCQEGLNCRSVKGIQGRLRGDTDVEFLFTREILSLTVVRAELHLQLSNPQHLDIHPVLPSLAKRNLPTRYSLWSSGSTVELRVDVLFLFQSLQKAAGGGERHPRLLNVQRVALSSKADPPREKPSAGALQDTDDVLWGDGAANTLPVLDLGLILGCSRDRSVVSCRTGGVHLSHTPFMALYYR